MKMKNWITQKELRINTIIIIIYIKSSWIVNELNRIFVCADVKLINIYPSLDREREKKIEFKLIYCKIKS